MSLLTPFVLFFGWCPLAITISITGPIKVTWMAPEDAVTDLSNLNAATSVGGLALAIQNSNSDYTFDINVNWEKSKCDAKQTLSRVYETFLGSSPVSPVAFFGPPCTDAMNYLAQLATYKDFPVIGWVSDSATFRSQERGTYLNYKNLIRVLPPINTIGRGLTFFLDDFDWHTVLLISSAGKHYSALGSGVNSALTSSTNYTLALWKSDVDDNATDTTIQDIYKQVKTQARIVILCIPRKTLRQWMLVARDMDMTNGDYAFIFANQELPTGTLYDDLTSADMYKGSDGRDNDARQAFQSLLILTVQTENTTRTSQFYTNAFAAAISTTPINWQNDFSLTAVFPGDGYSPYLHDAVRLYAFLVNETENSLLDYTKGTDLKSIAINRKFTGEDWVTGDVILDENGDRYPVFWLLSLDDSGVFSIAKETVITINGTGVYSTVSGVVDIIWGNGRTGDNNKPQDVPSCGFQNENCPKTTLYIILGVVALIVIVVVIVGVLLYRRYQFEQSLKDMVWKINRDDLQVSNKKMEGSALLRLSRASSIRRSTLSGLTPGGAAIRKSATHLSKADTASVSSEERQVFINTAHYKGTVVAWRQVRKSKLKLDRELMVEMKRMTDVNHTNLSTFIGATTETGDIVEVWEYSPKGSLQDVIWNENIKLDDMFKFSIAMDICKALKYLHDSPLKMHGRLKSSNCVIDGRWMCKLTDYCLFRLREGQTDDPELTTYKRYSREFWTAPEHLRLIQLEGEKPAVSKGRKISNTQNSEVIGRKVSEVRGTPASRPASQEGDVYAVGIILKEIFARNGPYTESDDYDPEEIIEKVKVGPSLSATGATSLFRPSLSEVRPNAPDKMMDVIRSAWDEKPSDRPSVPHLLKDIQRINPFKSASVMDNMIKMMERYSNNLEEMVEEKTSMVEEEKKKSEALLYKMLPESVAESLRVGKSVEAEDFEAVSIYFSDIVKFTNLSASSTPMQVVNLLNDLYTLFDSTIAEHDVYKVETIGDAYMLASGLPIRNGDNHAVEITNCAMDLLSGVMSFKVAHKPDYVLKLRIGLHTGPTVAGVVGVTMPRYCLFGNTVTIASSMESGGAEMRIHISPTTYKLLCKFSGYHLCAREANIDIPGIGKSTTYFVFNREGYSKPLPDFDELSKDETVPLKKLPITKGRPQRTNVPNRPSVESGIFELDTEDVPSRKPSATDGTPRLGDITENSSESVKSPSGEGTEDNLVPELALPENEDISPGPAPRLSPAEEARPLTAGPGALKAGVWSDSGPENTATLRQRKKSVMDGGVTLELEEMENLDQNDEPPAT